MRAGWDAETRTGYLQSNVLTLSPMPMNRSQLEVWRYDGDTARVHDLHRSTTGTATVTAPPGAWTGFVEDLKVDGGSEIHIEATVEEGALRLVTTVDGEAPIEQRFPALEGEACEAWLGRSPPVPDWPLGH